MDKNSLEFDVFADAKAKKTEIRWNMFLTVFLSILTIYMLFPIDRFGLYSRGSAENVYLEGTPAIVLSLGCASLFGFIVYICVKQLPKLKREMLEVPILYSFNKSGFMSYISGETYSWNDFKPFYYGKVGLHLPFKNKPSNSLVLGPAGISGESYVRIQKHIRAHAPKELSRKV